MNATARKYGTTNPVLVEARVNHDPYDEWAWCQEWRLAIADYLTFDLDEYVEDFRPSPMGPDDESYAYQSLRTLQPSYDDLVYAKIILARYAEWLRAAGKDY